MVVSALTAKCRDIIGNSSDTPVIDARVIVKHVLSMTDVRLVLEKDREVGNAECSKALKMAELRKKHVPIAYIVGFREFMSLIFKVEPGVLIPRPDTECIVEEIIGDKIKGKILDIGTGSGAIAVSLAKYIENADVHAVDISEKVLETAKYNAANNGVNVNFVKADIFNYKTEKKFDCIVSNPPYIESGEIEWLMSDVKDYEPISALDGGTDGLDFYRKIVEFCQKALNSGGTIYFEHGYRQFDSVAKLLENGGFSDIKKIYDLAGHVRGCKAVK